MRYNLHQQPVCLCAELMVLGFISLLLTFGQTYIISICIPMHLANTMLPCAYKPNHEKKSHEHGEAKADHHRRLLWYERRMLSGGAAPVGCKEVSCYF